MHDPFVDDMTPEEAAVWGIEAKAPEKPVVSPEEAAAADAWVKDVAAGKAGIAAGPPPSEDGPNERTWKIGGLYSIPAPPGKAKLLALDGELGVMDVGTGKVKLKLEIIGDELPDEEPAAAEPEKPKRTRRTKAEMAAARAAEASGSEDEKVTPQAGPAESVTVPIPPEHQSALGAMLNASEPPKEVTITREPAAPNPGRVEVVIKFDPDTLAVLRKLLGA